MKRFMLCGLIALPFLSFGQIGIKAGVNFANVTKSSSINNSSRSGFNAGIFLAPPSKKILSSRTELVFSRQGYNYKTNTNTGNVNLDYIMLPQYMAINITKFVQIQLGAQMAFLINAKADSNKTTGSSGSSPYGKMMDYYNRFDYGYGGGVEIHPVSGLLIGARINISLGDLYKDYTDPSSSTPPSFIPKVDVKNNVFQIYAGWTFGNKSEKKSKKKEE
ncbi:MAG: PorT family protein [Chitinophagaceae bacterium]|nr:PorT family protein [Chitinophagaceae bacterium]